MIFPTKTSLNVGKQILADLKPSIHIGSTHIYIGGTLGVARFPADASNALNC